MKNEQIFGIGNSHGDTWLLLFISDIAEAVTLVKKYLSYFSLDILRPIPLILCIQEHEIYVLAEDIFYR